MRRLPAPFGSRLDRARPLRFTFEGRAVEGFAGDTIASALLAGGETVLSRSFKYHRPRSVLTMAGGEANTLVQLPGAPNVFADLRAAADGLAVTPQNVAGTLARDRNAILDKLGRFLPVGFYYEAFHRPAGAWRYWEPKIRRAAGLGRIDPRPDAHAHGDADKQFLFGDVVVIGGGPAGIAAATAAHDAGAEVVLLDDQPQPGGALAYRRLDDAGARARLQAALAARPRIRSVSDARCTGAFADNWLSAIRGERLFKIRAKRVILATGAHEQIAVFRNNDLPGVMLGSAAQRLIREFAVAPGTRAVVATGTDDGYLVALDLLAAGLAVEAVVEFRGDAPASAARALLAGQGIRIIDGHGIVEAHPGPGLRSVAGLRVGPVEGRGRVGRGAAIDLVCDLVCVSAGWMPAFQLAAQAGARLRHDDARASFVLGDLPEGWDVAGSARGLRGHASVVADGTRAGLAAARAAGFASEMPSPEMPVDDPTGDHDWPIFPHPRGRDFVDFDEDLQVKDLERACALGYADIQLVKRFTTLGMGPSQGRHSALPGARVVAAFNGRSVDATNVTTTRPPLGGEKLRLLAGRAFDPVRHTPMHHRHLEAGAQMIPAGLWLRPAYYGEPGAREAAIDAEAQAVRGAVGLIDVSTLGGLDLRGPDAAELIERLYTGSFRQQKLGTGRYGVMTSEMGTIVDDGVIARFHERHFYVTATTTGVDAVHRKMLWWNAQWRLDVDITNVTSAFAAVNLAGPASRTVLARLCPDLALGAQDFPFGAARLARVAGIPARLLRVGFVGELGYEIHVPSGCGEALWDALLEAGRPEGIRRFGVEAQRLLRLEKGHFIVGQDTDGLSHPDEANCGWAVATKKPFFVGQRAIAIIRRAPPDRRLIGFTLPIEERMPDEGCLVLEGERITGYVTSIGRSRSVGAIIGLGFGSARQAVPGTAVAIKLADGRIVEARAARLPFYDPDNARQKM